MFVYIYIARKMEIRSCDWKYVQAELELQYQYYKILSWVQTCILEYWEMALVLGFTWLAYLWIVMVTLVMWSTKLFIGTVLTWIVQSLLWKPAALIIQYSADKCLQRRFRLAVSLPPVDDIWHVCRRYHWASRSKYCIDDTKPIWTFWSTSPQPLKKPGLLTAESWNNVFSQLSQLPPPVFVYTSQSHETEMSHLSLYLTLPQWHFARWL